MRHLLSKLALGLVASVIAMIAIEAQSGAVIPPNPALTINYLGESSLTQYLAANGLTISGSTAANARTNTTNLQNWLLNLQLQAITNSQSIDNLDSHACMVATIPKNIGNIYISSPIVVPRYVCTDFHTRLLRVGSAGSVTSNYAGDTTSQALANLYQPMIIYPPGSHNIGDLALVLNSNGSDRGSGFFAGRTWQIYGLTVASGGSGFVGGETCTTNTGDSKYPYTGASFTVSSASGGAATGITYTNTKYAATSGIYGLPPVLQANQWTAANGFPNVFDGSGNLQTTCSSGAGLTVAASWWPDWCDGVSTPVCSASTVYFGDGSNVRSYTQYLGRVWAVQSGASQSATYGNTRAIAVHAYDTEWDELQSQTAYNGISLFGPDMRGNKLNDVGSSVGLRVANGANLVVPGVVLNNNTVNYLVVDNYAGALLSGAAYMDGSHTPTATTAAMLFGANSGSSTLVSNSKFDFTLYNAGQAGGVPAIYCAYTNGTEFNIRAANLDTTGAAFPGQFSKYASFGTGCDSTNIFTGFINNVSGNIFTGTVPAAHFSIWQAATGQRITQASLSHPVAPQGRLTLSSTAAVMTADAFSVGTVYYLPYIGRQLPIYNGTYWSTYDVGASGLSLTLDATHQPTSKPYDVYAFVNSGTVTLCAQYWGASNSRSASVGGFSGGANSTLAVVNGLYTNATAIASGNCYGNNTSYALAQNQATYLGSFYTNGNGTTQYFCDGAGSGGAGSVGIFLWNAYNRVTQTCTNSDTATSVTSASSSWSLLGGNNTIYYLAGLQQSPISFDAFVVAGNGTQGNCGYFGITVNSQNSAPSYFGSTCAATGTLANNYQTISVNGAINPPGLGLSSINALISSAAGTTTYMPVTKQQNMRLTYQW